MHLQGTGVCARLYGSRARGNARRFSDIDIALSAGDRPVPAAVLAALAESLEESRIPFHVDIVDLYHAGKALAEIVEREGIAWTD